MYICLNQAGMIIKILDITELVTFVKLIRLNN